MKEWTTSSDGLTDILKDEANKDKQENKAIQEKLALKQNLRMCLEQMIKTKIKQDTKIKLNHT